MTVTDDALRSIVADYTREAGVRGLERQLGKLLRKVATKIAVGASEPLRSSIDADDVRDAGWAGPGSSPRWPSARRCPAWRPAWR